MTIFALSSGAGRTGVAVVRLSGPACAGVVRALAGRLPDPRRASLAHLRDPATGETLDQALVLWFPGPASFTGEDSAELHLHGGRAVVMGVLDALARFSGLRPAEAGEFTRRAFENGRIDLTEAEGLADLIAADTAAQRKLALRQMGGELHHLYDRWREALVRALAHAEAEIDFSDEELPDHMAVAVRARVAGLAADIARHLADGRRGERLRQGVQAVILGPPNVGKSSLLNALVRREAAIVSDIAGTTRDVLEVHLDLGGYPVTIADTAGLRSSGDRIEQEGIRRAMARAADADIRILLCDAADWPRLDPELAALRGEEAMIVVTKTDLVPVVADGMFPLSVVTGDGMEAFLTALQRRAAELSAAGDAPAWTRLRHRLALEDCLAALNRYLAAGLPELAAEDLRLAMRALGRLTGYVDVEDLLDIVFRDFCIGK